MVKRIKVVKVTIPTIHERYVGQQMVTRLRAKLYRAHHIRDCYVDLDPNIEFLSRQWLRSTISNLPPSRRFSVTSSMVFAVDGTHNIRDFGSDYLPLQNGTQKYVDSPASSSQENHSANETDETNEASESNDFNDANYANDANASGLSPSQNVQQANRHFFNPFLRITPAFAYYGRRRTTSTA